VTGGFHEQDEKLENAERGLEESRYSQQTLADLRANFDGMQSHYAGFSVLLRTKTNGSAIDDAVKAGMARFKTQYDKLSDIYGNKLPPVPPTWDEKNVSETDKATDFGQLYELMEDELKTDNASSLTSTLNQASDALGIARLSE
jgi:hypothetical protein